MSCLVMCHLVSTAAEKRDKRQASPGIEGSSERMYYACLKYARENIAQAWHKFG